jgi:hypothetical protein
MSGPGRYVEGSGGTHHDPFGINMVSLRTALS